MEILRLCGVAAVAFGVTACQFGSAVPEDLAIACVPGGASCPTGYHCQASLGRCISNAPAPLLALHASSPMVAPRGASQVEATGGVPPYVLSFAGAPESGPLASIDGTGTYHAGLIGSSVDQVEVTDANASTAFAQIQVGPSLALTPLAATVAPSGTLLFTAIGGQPPYLFAIQRSCQLDGGAPPTISAMDSGQALYLAGGACGNNPDLVTVTDVNGVVAGPASVSIGAALVLRGPGSQVTPGAAASLAAFGGAPPYQFGYSRHGNASGGTLDPSGTYVAGLDANTTDHVQVIDQLGTTAEGSVRVGPTPLPLAVPQPLHLGTGNFNGDAFGDLLGLPLDTAGAGASYLGDPLGMVPAVDWRFADGPETVTIGDLNGDGCDDLILGVWGADGGTWNLPVYLGGNDGSLTLGPTLILNQPVSDLAVVRSVDALAVAASNGNLELFVMAPDGGGGPSPLGSLPLVHVASLRLGGEINLVPLFRGSHQVQALGDAVAAYVESNDDNGPPMIALWLGLLGKLDAPPFPDGGATVIPPSLVLQLPQPEGYGTLLLTDLDGDGLPDVVVGEVDALTATFAELLPFLGLPDGGERPLSRFAPAGQQTGWSIHPLVSSGVGPQRLDLVGDVLGGVELGLAPDGGLAIVEPLPGQVMTAAANDFDGDGTTDEALSFIDGTLELLEGSPSGSFGTGLRAHLNRLGTAPQVAVGDLDGDGFADLLSADLRGASMFSGTPGGELGHDGQVLAEEAITAATLAPSGGWLVSAPSTGALELWRLAEVDGGSLATTQLSLGGLVTGTLGSATLTPMQAGGPIDGGDLLLGYLDSTDSDRAMVLVVEADGGVQVAADLGPFLSPPGVVVSPSGAPTVVGLDFETNQVFLFEEAAGAWPSTPTETIDADQLANGCGIFIGSFSPLALQVGAPLDQLLVEVGFTGQAPCIGAGLYRYDLATRSITTVIDPDGPLAPLATYSVQAVDLDGDGYSDIVVSTSSLGVPVVLWGDGQGGFQAAPLPVLLGRPAVQVLAGDFNGDGWVDLALVANQGVVNLLYNQGPTEPRSFR